LSSSFLLAALGTTIYGGRLYLILKRFPIDSASRRAKQREVRLTVVICALVFVLRATLLLLFTFLTTQDLNPYFTGLFYVLVEIIPNAAIRFILRKLPPKREVAFAPFRTPSFSSVIDDDNNISRPLPVN
jgi:uncharacterized membrane-anchored protein